MVKLFAMKKTYLISLLALMLIVASGCKEDFLDVRPTQFLTEDQVAEAASKNPDVIAGSMSGIYTLMFQTGTGGTTGHDDFGQKGYDIMGDFLSGDLALSVSTYGWYRTLTQFTVTTDFTTNGNYIVWRYYYRLIRSANSVIAALGGNDAVPELDANKHIMGQAKAMRAHSYFYLAQYYAKSYNPTEEILPIYDDPTTPNQPKSTTQEVYAMIIKDLQDAISLLGNFQRSAKNEVNKPVAQAILAYVYATMGGNDNLALAKNLAADVIATGGFTITPPGLVTFAGSAAVGGFNDVSSPSWMWGVDLTTDNGLNLISWWGQMDKFTYSYQWAGDRKAIDAGLYAAIPADDIRKGQFEVGGSYNLVASNKFYPPVRTIAAQRFITTDYVYMRIEEMFLLHAEVAAKSGDETAARNSLKTFLAQRIPNTSYVDGLTGQALQNEIYLQTRIEFFAEGKSYLAMKRNKATITRGSNHLSFVGTPVAYDDPRLTFEIPQSEIQNNPFIN